MTTPRVFPLRACTLLLAFFVFSAFLGAQEMAKPNPADQSTFDVIGISVRTNNAAEAGPNGEIPKAWQRLFMEGTLNRIPARSDEAIIAVYTRYASDANGDYTYILGAKVAPGTKAPEGMVAVTVPAGKYLEFVSAKGPGQEVLPVIWQQIYRYFQGPGTPARAFKTDFERYEGPFEPNAVQAHIFVGVKPQ
jgi:predicted transcriptional regulator YdeE